MEWEQYVGRTRAVIEALRELDQSMLDRITDRGDEAQHNARAIWRHMLDQLLSAEPR